MTVIADYVQTQPYNDQESTTHIRAHLICDTQSDLPAPTDIPLYTLDIGSKADIIADSTEWKMQSDGSWIQQLPPEAAATYSKAEIDSMIDTINNDLQDLSLDIRDVGLDVTDLTTRVSDDELLIHDLYETGAKNILPIITNVTTETKRGITAVYDPIAGAVTLNGTHDGTGDAIFYLYTGAAADTKIIPAGHYRLSGCPAGGSTDTYCLIVNGVGGSPAYKLDTGSGQDFTITADGHMAPIIRIRKPADQTVRFDNVVFRPMICRANLPQDFVPYTPTLRDLYLLIKSYHP